MEDEEIWRKKLTPEEFHVCREKGTERPFTGEYWDCTKEGVYNCRCCGEPLFLSDTKFDAHCGWPSFDDEIKGAVTKKTDADGRRTEILCANCDAHLGHVFTGEKLTAKDTRHCVNSISLLFKVEVPKAEVSKAEATEITKAPAEALAYFGGGCFWGVEYYLEKRKGVSQVLSGYMGGTTKSPTYKEICTGKTGHVEVVEVHYDPSKISYQALAKLFFEIHDPTQADGQGPDIGPQYLSVIFCANEQEVNTVKELIAILNKKGYKVATEIRSSAPFWKAEAYHQDYYQTKGSTPYCHGYTKRF